MSSKGGVGKSTLATNLAWSLAGRGHQTGLLDADINGPSIPLMIGLQDRVGAGTVGFEPVQVLPNLSVLSIAFFLNSPDTPTTWRGPLKGGVIGQFVADVEWGPLDYLVIDLPPGTGTARAGLKGWTVKQSPSARRGLSPGEGRARGPSWRTGPAALRLGVR